MNFIKKNKFVLFLTLFGVILFSIPLFIFGVNKSFYINPDPDVVYFSNAILFLKSGTIAYFDHPGTPSILLFSLFLSPITLFIKYVLHGDISTFAFYHYPALSFYLRILVLSISGFSLFLFLKLIGRIAKTKLIIWLAFLLVIVTGIYSRAVAISPEAVSILLATIWLSVFVNYVSNKKFSSNILLIVISALAFVNKFTNGALLFFSLLIPLLNNRDNKGRVFKQMVTNILLAVAVLLISSIPIFDKLGKVGIWVKLLITHAGDYGGGKLSFFDWGTYSASFMKLIETSPFVFIFVIFSFVFLIWLLISKKYGKSDKSFIYLYFLALICFMYFAKYPVIRYNYVNLLLMIFSTVYFVKNLISASYIKIIVGALVVMSIITFGGSISKQIESKASSDLETKNEYMYFALKDWTKYWGGDVFLKERESFTP